jgi:CubicO group peptidase (beta-lactamase class C family)
MRTRRLLSALAIVGVVTPAFASAGSVPEWLAGCWSGTVRGDHLDERWTRPAPGILVGTSTTTRDGALRSFEFLRIVIEDGRTVYVAQPGGRPPAAFPATAATGRSIVFENPTHDFPKRIAYEKRDDGSLLAWIDGGEEAAGSRIEFPLTRSSCEAVSPAVPLADDPRVARALELARRWLELQAAYDRIPGLSAAIVHDQERLWSGGFGLADPERGTPAGADTLYSICSISKLFTAVAVMRERDLGHLRLDDPVSTHLPWFRVAKPLGEGDVTVEGILTHASGIMREADFPYWTGDFDFPGREEIIARVPGQGALYEPETTYQYSNLGFTLAGEIVAATSEIPYADYVTENILRPLGLSSTTPEMPASERGRRLAVGHTQLDREGKRRPLPFFTGDGVAPAMGFASSVDDLARFASWQFRLLEKGGTEVIRATTLREMQRVHWAEPPDWQPTRGLGFSVRGGDGKVVVGHGGSCPGYLSNLSLEPDSEIAAVVAMNGQGIDVSGYGDALRALVGPAVAEAVKTPGGGVPTDPGLLAYVGTYDLTPWGGEVLVAPWGDGLVMIEFPTMKPVEEWVRLKRTGAHAFRVVDKHDKEREPVVFEMGPDGRAKSFTQHSNAYPRTGP